MKTLIVTLCKNESALIPFAIKYWQRIADKVIVYDNYSEDNSVELLSKYDFVEVRHFQSPGQQEIIQKELKEKTYLEFKDAFDVIILCDMDELFFFRDYKTSAKRMLDEGYDCMITPIYSLCNDVEPTPSEKLLHQQCTMFYKQKMNHTPGFEEYSKFSIFNCHTVDGVSMSVGQHFVRTSPNMRIMLENDAFCLHTDKGFSPSFYLATKRRMGKNLSDFNKRNGMATEYLKSDEEHLKDYKEHQEKSFNLNEKISF